MNRERQRIRSKPGRPGRLLLVILMLLLVASLVVAQDAPTSFNEAPALAERVAAGELPPVEERLPPEPQVVQVVDRIGQYGGTWDAGMVGSQSQLNMTIGYENLTRWDPEWTRVVPNIAQSFEVNDDATEYTFHLRPGIRWSDGEPFTADDVLFWWEDVALNAELSPGGPPAWMQAGGEPATVTKVDDHTFTVSFSEPYGMFLMNLAMPDGALPTLFPRHYLEQFHQDYNDDVEALARQEGVSNWVDLWAQKAGDWIGPERWSNPERPVLAPWVITVPLGEGSSVVAERNPYYWKVDPEGNQLPYIDRVSVLDAADAEVLLLRALAGDIDMQHLRIATLANRPVLAEGREQGNYSFFETIPTSASSAVIALNFNHRNEALREVFRNKDFRIGLSHAINRQEIIDVVYLGQGEPWQVAPRPTTAFYNEQLAKQYTEYDPELANQYLDQAGYTERNAQGIRLGPDGQPISFRISTSTDLRSEYSDVLELVQGYWREVGVDMQIDNIGRSLIETRVDANEFDAEMWNADGGGPDAVINPIWYLPITIGSDWALGWAAWYLEGGVGEGFTAEEPPAPVRRQMELYDRLKSTGDQDEQAALFEEILQIAADEFPVIGISLPPNGYGIVHNDFHNVPAQMYESWPYPTPGPTNPEQYFITGE